jgi:hypothetical protein
MRAMGMGFATVVALAAGQAVAAAPQPEPVAATMERPTALHLTQTPQPMLDGTRWVGVDPLKRQLLVLQTPVAPGLPRLLLLSADGGPPRSHALPAFDAEATEVHLFPAARKVAIASFTDTAEPDAESVAEAEDPDVASGRVWLVDLTTGRSTAVSGVAGAVYSDPAHGRLFLVQGRVLRVVDVATGRNVAMRRFGGDITNLVVSANGDVHLLQAPAEAGPARLVSLAPPQYKVFRRQTLSRASSAQVLLGVDERRKRAFIRDEIEPDVESDLDTPSIVVERLDAGGRGVVLAGPTRADSRLFGQVEGAHTVALQDPGSGLLSLYDADSMRLLHTLQDFYGQFIGVERGGTVLVSSGKTLQRRDPRSFDVLQSFQVDGFIQYATYDPKANRVYAIVESQSPAGSISSRLVQVDLERLQPVL